MNSNTILAALISRVSLGDRGALKELYDSVGGKLLAVAFRVLDNRGVAEDILQEVFITIWNQAGSYNSDYVQPFSWLCAITRNRAIDQLRKTQLDVPLNWHDADGEEHTYDAPDERDTPLESLINIESGNRLHECLNALESEQKQVLLLAYFEGLTHSELAQRLKRPLGTIKAWTRRSLMRLRTCLETAS
jgi:RNA polymerase sigma-70 factor (ECF subfamily)